MPPQFPPTPPTPPKPLIERGPMPPAKPLVDLQTRNVLLFAIIFSILATLVGGYFLLKPRAKTPDASTVAISTTTVTAPKNNGFFGSFFGFPTTPSGTSTAAQGGPFSIQPTNMFGTPTTQTSNQNTRSSPTPAAPVGNGTQTSTGNPPATNVTTSLNNDSPLRGKIWISSVSLSSNASSEYVVLATNPNSPQRIPLTGLTLKSKVTGQVVQIGQGVYLPILNQTPLLQDINDWPGRPVIVSTGHSPLGYSFQLNKCTGYLAQYQNFTPGLPISCPLLREIPPPQVPNQLSDKCLDLIDSWPACRVPTSYSNPGTNDQLHDCQVFFQDHTGYQYCVDTHKADPDFWGPEWRVYVNHDQPIWKSKREIIWLLDQQGRFISQYSY